MVGRHTKIVTDVTHLRKIGSSVGLTVPKLIREALRWGEGEALLVTAADNRVVLESLLEHMTEAKSANDKQAGT